MDICGYVYLYDSKTNRQDTLKISVYNCKNISHITETTSVRNYVFDKKTLRLISDNNDFSLASYLMLCEIASTAIELDKVIEYPAIAEFNLDFNGNPHMKLHNTHKDIFPLPCKSDVYMKNKVYFNITDRLFGAEHTTVLKSSMLVNLLNFIALRDGYIRDWLFSAVCGRVFLNATYAACSVRGSSRLRRMFPEHFKSLRHEYAVIPSGITMKRYKTNIKKQLDNDEFVNPFLKIASSAFTKLAETDYNIFDSVEAPDFLIQLVEAQIEEYSKYFENLLWQGVVKNYDDFDYITYDDLLSLSLPYGRDMLKYHLINNRKFFNAHKSKKITALFSNGQIS